MNKIVTAAVVSALALGGVAATAVPADASSRGTVTTKEATKLVRALDHQKCVTKKEARKIVHGKGHSDKGTSNFGGEKQKYVVIGWDASRRSKMEGVAVYFYDTNNWCATMIIDVYPKNKAVMHMKGLPATKYTY